MTEPKSIQSISDLQPDPDNANLGTERGLRVLDDSLRECGAGRSILADRDGTVLAGNKTLLRAADIGLPVRVVQTNGTELVVVQRTDLALSGDDGQRERARRLAYLDNFSSEQGLKWDAEQILADLEAGVNLDGLWRDDELTELLDSFAADLEKGDIKGDKPNPRNLPLDVVYTIDSWTGSCCAAVCSGLKYGVQSTGQVCGNATKGTGRHAVVFVDNDFKDYDHELHKRLVGRWEPKYATVRDIMSQSQCKEAGIKFYSFEQIMRWAEQLEQYAENVIVIPKYDYISKIPERYVLGYSVPTSYGGTPLPTDKFRGRRIHLLGGTWKRQLDYLALLGNDVVSIDFNEAQKQSTWGQFYDPNGNVQQVKDIGAGWAINVRYIALALSFGAIGAKVNELYAGNSDPV